MYASPMQLWYTPTAFQKAKLSEQHAPKSDFATEEELWHPVSPSLDVTKGSRSESEGA